MRQKFPVRIGRHYSQDALLGNRYLALASTLSGLERCAG